MLAQESISTSPNLDYQQFNQARAEAFAEKMIGTLNAGALALMTSIGHRTGLFDCMAKLSPATSVRIAEAASLDERYVREWLGAMVTGQIVEHDNVRDTYYLPPEHAAWLTRNASPNNLAVSSQWIPLLASVEEQIIRCFREGGGVPYSSYTRFHQVMAEESDQTTLSALLDSILPIVPELIERLRAGINVLEVGCGSGRALNMMAEAFPASRFTGYDFSEEGIAVARREASERNLTNVRFAVKDVAELDERAQYDLVTAFDVIHDQAEPGKVLLRIAQVLKLDGVFLMQDIRASSHVHKNLNLPLGTFGYTVSCMHCMSVSLAQDGKGLGAMWGEECAEKMLKDVGFRTITVRQLAHDILNNYYVATRG